jgi:magnesium transporter
MTDDERTDGPGEAAHLPETPGLTGEHPADLAAVIESLSAAKGAEILATLPPQTAADALEQMDEHAAEEYVQELDPESAATAVAHMAPDDAADLLSELPNDQRTVILARLPLDERQQLETLLSYPPESAGGMMSPQVTSLPADMPVAQAIARLREIADETEQVYYTYVVDEGGRLVGVLSLRDLMFGKPLQPLSEIMRTRVVSVPVEMDREQVAALMTRYGYLALPVVDARQRLVGIVTADDVMDVLQQEATEDMQRMVGAGADERIDSPLALVLTRRLPWLVVNLATAFLAAGVVSLFDTTLDALPVLAFLMPIVAGQAGNTGAQAMVVMIRSIATGDAARSRVFGILARQVLTGAAAGVLIGLLAFVATYGWLRYQSNADAAEVATVIGLAMLFCLMIASVAGALVPLVMKELGFDPAQCSSIILTAITDCTGFGIFLGLGSLILVTRAGG